MFDHQHSYDRVSGIREADKRGDSPSNINKFGAQRAHALYTIKQVLETLEVNKDDEIRVIARMVRESRPELSSEGSIRKTTISSPLL